MYVIEDPDYWYRQEDSTTTEVVNPDGDSLELIDVMEASSIRKIRHRADQGKITETYVTRDFDNFSSNWEAIAARSHVENAPKIIKYYDDHTDVLSNIQFRARFSDVERYETYLKSDSEYKLPLRVNALNLIIADRKGQSQIPLPSLVKKEGKLVSECLGIDSQAGIQRVIIRDLISSDGIVSALEEASNTPDEYQAWSEYLGWIEDGEISPAGKQALSYVKDPLAEKTEWESYAILAQAQDAALERSNTLISTKLEKAKNELSISTELTDLDSNFQSVLVKIASENSFDMARELADQKGALRSIDAINVDEDEIRRYIRESRPRELTESLINNLEQVPLSLYSSSPTTEIQAVVDALEARKVISDLDTAIANGQSQIDKVISKLEEITDLIEPLASAQVDEVRSNLKLAKEMFSALSPPSPESPMDCIELYDEQLEREASLSTQFGETESKIADSILAVCEDYIRDTYRQWAHDSLESREIAMIPDIPTKIENLLDDHNHILLIVSDGFGLRQWIEATYNNNQIRQWSENGVISNTPMTTIFPSETGAGHYSLFTGQFPMDHGRDDIEKTITPSEGHLFDRARKAGAYTQALSYLHDGTGGFSEVIGNTADEFIHLKGLRSEDAAFQKKTVKHIANVVDQHEKSVHFLQHNQIDQLHDGTDHIADSLIPGVADDLATFVKQLTQRLGDEILPVLTADHGMIRTKNSRRSLTSGDGLSTLKSKGEYYEDLGQRVAGLKDKNQPNQSFGNQLEHNWFEVLSKQTMQELRALTKDKCDGRTLRFKRRFYSESSDMTATHGAFTFDEMFIPFVEFDTNAIATELE